MNGKNETEYKRLETDSSDEDKQEDRKTVKNNKSSLKLKQELLQKEQEIENLKQILIQTQEKLLKSCENTLDQVKTEEILVKGSKKFVEKIENLVFVSKKNQLLLEEFDEVRPNTRNLIEHEKEFETEGDKVSQELTTNDFSEKPGLQLIDEGNTLKKNSFELISEISVEQETSLFEKSGKFEGNKDKSDKNSENWENASRTMQNQGSGDSFVGISNGKLKESPSSGSILRTPTLKIHESVDSKESLDSSFESLKEIQTILNSKYEDSQTKLKGLFYENVKADELKFESPFKIGSKAKMQKTQATNTDINDFDHDVKSEIVAESRIERIDKELRGSVGTIERGIKNKSRNSSFPWIDQVPQEYFNPPLIQQEKNPKRPKKRRRIVLKSSEPIQKSSEPIQKKLPPKPPVPKFSKKKNYKRKSSKPFKDQTLDDIIFDEGQDLVSWRQKMYKFRNNPEIVSKLMKSKIRPLSQTSTKAARPKSSNMSSNIHSRYSNNPSSANTLPEYRPLSSSGISKMAKKIHDPDWSNSILDNYVSQNKKKFNFFSDHSLINPQEIDEILMSIENRLLRMEDLKKTFLRALKTLNVLKIELMLPEFWVTLPPFSDESLVQALGKCGKLLKARNLTVKIIDLVHKRENLMISVVERDGMGRLSELERVNEELLQVLVFWRYMELPFTSFIYLGEDYYDKIHKDNMSIRALFPDFRVDSGFRGSQNSDSFNFEL